MRDLSLAKRAIRGIVVYSTALFAAATFTAATNAQESPAKIDRAALETVAERTDYQATSRHEDVLRWCDALTKSSPLVRRIDFGRSHEQRPLPLLVVADPPVAAPRDAARTERLVLLVFANIHAGEVDGKEAVMQWVRDLTLAEQRPLLQHAVLLIVPNLNPDGNDRMAVDRRPGQAGPAQGMGTRENAQGLDLNRDFVKLESPEIRALVRVLERWDPHVVVDMHTTNGSYHRHTITYDVNRHPASDPRLIAFARDQLTPDFDRRLDKLGGWKGAFYGNFANDHTEWATYEAWPRFSTQYVALRQRIGVLCESYSYAPYRERIQASRDFCQAVLETVVERRDEIRKTLADARRESSQVDGKRTTALRHKATPLPQRRVVLGWEEKREGEKTIRTDVPRDYPVTYLGGAEATQAAVLPYAYLIPETYSEAIATLQRHGVRVERLREDVEVDVEAARVTRLQRAGKPFQNHSLVTLDVELRKETRRVPHGTCVVVVNQPLGALAAFLLEPLSEDGLATWNLFDASLAEGGDYPVLRLSNREPLLLGEMTPPPELRVTGRRITMGTLHDGADDGSGAGDSSAALGRLSNRGAARLAWLEDGEHYLETRGSVLYRVAAATGRKQPLVTSSDKLRDSLAVLPSIGPKTAERFAKTATLHLNPAHTAALWNHERDLYYATLDGARAVRLTATPDREELASFSPDGQFIAYVSNQDLYVVDVATAASRRLTTDGGGKILNGQADWVYFEELFNRNERAFWWSSDSRHLVFLRTDDSPVAPFTVLDPVPPRQPVELTPYPKAGDPLPIVQIGIVSVGGEAPVFAKLDDYSAQSLLVAHAGFTRDGKQAYAYLLNRQQTWMDVVTIDLSSGEVRRLFRETTKAWVEEHGALEFLADGTFLFPSERDGYRHLYRYAADGRLLGRVTAGPWEVLRVHQVDERAGRVVFSANKENWRGSQLFSVKLDGGDLRRIGAGEGTQTVTWSPRGNLYATSTSTSSQPPRVELRDGEGKLVRTLDDNRLPALEEFAWGRVEEVQIGLTDGFTLEGRIIYPPDFDAGKRYPVWVKTYGGPHAPTVRDAWQGGGLEDQAHASAGFLVFRVDPRPASGKGAASAWTAYRQLGKQELADLEAAVRWLGTRPYVDLQRVGLSGYSYGGFLTAYALTHSRMFAAGIAGAPVTDWRNYDAIYTERYMDTPQDNPDGYRASSAVAAAKDLHGRLLIVHGVRDDNVHVQNTLQLLGALQSADKYAEVQLYPSARHGIGGKHFPKLSFDFMQRTLRPSSWIAPRSNADLPSQSSSNADVGPTERSTTK
ncbi:MAG: DPP IV N-terminal domain-containing protein [Pirellulales bacterium]